MKSKIKTIEFKEIEKFTFSGGYAVDVDFKYLPTMLKRYEEEFNLEMCPDFQRGHVWTKKQQIAFIEFVIRGGLTGKSIYFNFPDWMGDYNPKDRMVLVDGLQRLTAVLRFMDDKLPILGGYRKSQITGTRWNNIYFRFHINNLKTRAEVLKWYLEMNSGGVVHSKKELDRVQQLLDQEGGLKNVGS